jgi:transcriptional regulator with XRE-family HTH domain
VRPSFCIPGEAYSLLDYVATVSHDTRRMATAPNKLQVWIERQVTAGKQYAEIGALLGGASKSTLSRYRSGERFPGKERLRRISRATGISVDTLIALK